METENIINEAVPIINEPAQQQKKDDDDRQQQIISYGHQLINLFNQEQPHNLSTINEEESQQIQNLNLNDDKMILPKEIINQAVNEIVMHPIVDQQTHIQKQALAVPKFQQMNSHSIDVGLESNEPLETGVGGHSILNGQQKITMFFKHLNQGKQLQQNENSQQQQQQQQPQQSENLKQTNWLQSNHALNQNQNNQPLATNMFSNSNSIFTKQQKSGNQAKQNGKSLTSHKGVLNFGNNQNLKKVVQPNQYQIQNQENIIETSDSKLEMKEKQRIMEENRKLMQENEKLQQEVKKKEQAIAEKTQRLEKQNVEKDKAQKELLQEQNRFSNFQLVAKQKLCTLLLEEETLRRVQKKNELLQLKQRLGEMAQFRDGTRYDERWVDGYELRGVKEKIQKLDVDILQLEDSLQVMKDKEAKALQTENANKLANQSKKGNNIKHDANQQTMDQYMQPHNQNQNIENGQSSSNNELDNETSCGLKGRLNFRIEALKKDKNDLLERLKKLDQEKKLAHNMYRRANEEDNCRFAHPQSNPPLPQWPLLKDRYQFLSLLGKGGFSEVYKAFDFSLMTEVACKVHQLNPNWMEEAKRNYIKHALRENEIHQKLNHPNIIQQYASEELDINSFFTVLEYCEGPDLSAYLKVQTYLSEKEAKNIIKQIIAGTKYLHQQTNSIIHYDLKPQNIMFKRGEIKLSDFGLCKVMEQDCTRLELTSQGVGTYWYLPPECFFNNSANPPKINNKVDVWSIGVILYELLFGERPFGNNMSQEQILKNNVILKAHSVNFPSKIIVSEEAKSFIRKCLTYNMEDRWSIFEAAQSPYLDQNYKKLVAPGDAHNKSIKNYFSTKQ